jgi:cytochrome P450
LQLIANPKVQGWLREEITHVASAKDGSSNDYRAIYPKLKRCQAVLLETLRLYPAVWSIPRRVSQQPFKLNLSFGLDEEQEVILPPKAYVGACVASVQMQTTIWGSDAESWRPSRWIDVDEESTAIGNEKLIEPVKGSFGAWSHGPQNCLGQKFSQVEFVAVLVELLANYNLEAVPKPQESPGQTQERVMSILRDIEVLMLVKLRRGDAVRVRLREVE